MTENNGKVVRVECKYCGIEHPHGTCLNHSKQHYKKAFDLHGMDAEISVRVVDGDVYPQQGGGG